MKEGAPSTKGPTCGTAMDEGAAPEEISRARGSCAWCPSWCPFCVRLEKPQEVRPGLVNFRVNVSTLVEKH